MNRTLKWEKADQFSLLLLFYKHNYARSKHLLCDDYSQYIECVGFISLNILNVENNVIPLIYPFLMNILCR